MNNFKSNRNLYSLVRKKSLRKTASNKLDPAMLD